MFTSNRRLMLAMLIVLAVLSSTHVPGLAPAWGPLERAYAHSEPLPQPAESDTMGPQASILTPTAGPDCGVLESDTMGPTFPGVISSTSLCGAGDNSKENPGLFGLRTCRTAP
jgi:hypothetical protein